MEGEWSRPWSSTLWHRQHFQVGSWSVGCAMLCKRFTPSVFSVSDFEGVKATVTRKCLASCQAKIPFHVCKLVQPCNAFTLAIPSVMTASLMGSPTQMNLLKMGVLLSHTSHQPASDHVHPELSCHLHS